MLQTTRGIEHVVCLPTPNHRRSNGNYPASPAVLVYDEPGQPCFVRNKHVYCGCFH